MEQARKPFFIWDRQFREQMRDPTMRRPVEEELTALRVGTENAPLRRASVRER